MSIWNYQINAKIFLSGNFWFIINADFKFEIKREQEKLKFKGVSKINKKNLILLENFQRKFSLSPLIFSWPINSDNSPKQP